MSTTNEKRKIVTSEQLATDEEFPLSEVEFGLNVAYNTFSTWTVRCASAAGLHDMNHLDILVLHLINRNNNPRKKADICFMINTADSHTVNYTLKKLMKRGLADSEKKGKEIYYKTSSEGKKGCEEYKKIRELCLMPSMKSLDCNGKNLTELAKILRGLSGFYDQASRAAASF